MAAVRRQVAIETLFIIITLLHVGLLCADVKNRVAVLLLGLSALGCESPLATCRPLSSGTPLPAGCESLQRPSRRR